MDNFSFEATSRVLTSEQGDIHYHEAGDGPALLLIHGSGPGVTAWANYQHNLPVFAEHYRCIALDLPGYGKSAGREGQPIEVCIAATLELMDALNIASAHIIGNSLGGLVGSHIAARSPEKVERFVTIGGVGLNLFSAFPGEGISLLTAFIEDPTRDRVKQWLSSMVYDQSLITDELVERRYTQALQPSTFAATKQLYAKEAIEALAAFREAEGSIATISHLPNVKAPTLITWGRDDRVTPLDIGLIPMRIIPNAELHVFPQCGHWAMIEKKHAFETLVIGFLGRQS